MTQIRIATWNVNSVRSRIDRLLSWLQRKQPDVLCLQELKCQNDQFPEEVIGELGYHSLVHGQKQYNGVAILSRQPAEDVQIAMGDDVDDPQARIIAGRFGEVQVVCVYVPNGADLSSDAFVYKLQWLKRLRDLLERKYSPDQPLLLCGDTNVLLRDCDAADPQRWAQTGIGCEEARQALRNVMAWGNLTDLLGDRQPAGGVYSWWDYRNMSFPMNQGMRIDHILATPSIASHCTDIIVDRDERKGQKPSDHAPVIAVFELV